MPLNAKIIPGMNPKLAVAKRLGELGMIAMDRPSLSPMRRGLYQDGIHQRGPGDR